MATGLGKCTPTSRIVHRTQLSPAAGTAALITWVTIRRPSRRHTGTSIRSGCIRCHLVLSPYRPTAPVFLLLSHCLALIPSMLVWVARAPAYLRYRTLVLSPRLHPPQAYRKPSRRRLALSLVLSCPATRKRTGPAIGLRIAQLHR